LLDNQIMPQEVLFQIIVDSACIIICIIATIFDARTRRIPNKLTLTGFLLGIIFNFGFAAYLNGFEYALKSELLLSMVGASLLFFTFLLFASLKAVGMGDVKLMAAVGAFVGFPLAVWVLAFVLLSGGIISILYALLKGHLKSVIVNMGKGASSVFQAKSKQTKIKMHYMPYALAICIGTTIALLQKYLDILY